MLSELLGDANAGYTGRKMQGMTTNRMKCIDVSWGRNAA